MFILILKSKVVVDAYFRRIMLIFGKFVASFFQNKLQLCLVDVQNKLHSKVSSIFKIEEVFKSLLKSIKNSKELNINLYHMTEK